MNLTHRFLPRNAGRAYPDRRLPLSGFMMSGQLSRLDRSHHRHDATHHSAARFTHSVGSTAPT